MEMKDVIILLQDKIQVKANEISRMEKDLSIAKSVLNNDMRSLITLLHNHYPELMVPRLPEGTE